MPDARRMPGYDQHAERHLFEFFTVSNPHARVHSSRMLARILASDNESASEVPVGALRWISVRNHADSQRSSLETVTLLESSASECSRPEVVSRQAFSGRVEVPTGGDCDLSHQPASARPGGRGQQICNSGADGHSPMRKRVEAVQCQHHVSVDAGGVAVFVHLIQPQPCSGGSYESEFSAKVPISTASDVSLFVQSCWHRAIVDQGRMPFWPRWKPMGWIRSSIDLFRGAGCVRAAAARQDAQTQRPLRGNRCLRVRGQRWDLTATSSSPRR